MKRFRQGLQPESDWGPALQKHRLEAGYPLLPSDVNFTRHDVTTKKLHGENYEMITTNDPNNEAKAV